MARRFTRRGPAGGNGSGKAGPRRGFFVGASFVSLDHVPESELEAFFGGGSKPGARKGMHGVMKCFNCGKPGHFARECKAAPSPGGGPCFSCGKNGHKAHDCPLKNGGGHYFAATDSEVLVLSHSEREASACEAPPDFRGVVVEEIVEREKSPVHPT